MCLRFQPITCFVQLPQHHRTDIARPDQTNRHGLWREIKTRVHRSQRAGRINFRNGNRNVALGRTLRNGTHIHIGACKLGKHFRRDALGARHAIAHHGQNRDVRRDTHRFDLSTIQFTREICCSRPIARWRLDWLAPHNKSNAQNCLAISSPPKHWRDAMPQTRARPCLARQSCPHPQPSRLRVFQSW